MQKFLKRKYIAASLAILGLVFLYFLPRLAAIKSFPMFNDEAIYVRWAQQGYFDAGKRLESLSDGKQPMYIWLVTILMRFVPSPLAAGRLVSLAAGLGTMFGLGLAAYGIFGNMSVAGVAMLLYALYPFAVIHDRMALYDSFLGFLYVWIINAVLYFVRKPTLGAAFILANLFGIALLTKSTATLFFFIIPLAFFLYSKALTKRMVPKVFYFVGIAVVFSYLYQSILYLSPDQEFVAAKNAIFMYPLSHIFGIDGIKIFFSNLITMVGWVISYLTIPVSVAVLVPLFVKNLRTRQYVFLAASFFVPFLAVAAVGKTIFPRHIFFTTLPLLLIAACVVVSVKNRWYRIIVLLGFISFSLFSDFMIIKDLPRAPIPEIDRFQYINGPPAGGGIREIVSYIARVSSDKQIAVATEGAFGSLPRTAIELYFFQSPNIHIFSFSENAQEVPKEIVDAAKIYPVYIIFNKMQVLPSWPMQKILEVQKGNGPYFMRLFRYNPT